MSHSPVCKNPFCKWYLLSASVHPVTRYEFEFKYTVRNYLQFKQAGYSHIRRAHCDKICCGSLGRPKIDNTDNVSMPRGREGWAVQCHFPLIRDKGWGGVHACAVHVYRKSVGNKLAENPFDLIDS